MQHKIRQGLPIDNFRLLVPYYDFFMFLTVLCLFPAGAGGVRPLRGRARAHRGAVEAAHLPGGKPFQYHSIPQ